ncbi:MAG: heme-binding domain-containing protein [Bacteroidota bacterium]
MILKRILIAVVALVLMMQFFRIDKRNPIAEPSEDFINRVKPDAEITALLKSACYDCHSYTTEYPWYSDIAPVSWWLKHHINEGREELNFSAWGSYTERKAEHKLEECAELVEEGEMPLSSYTWTHKDAKLTAIQKEKLAGFFNSLRK